MLGKSRKHKVGRIDTLVGQNTELLGDLKFSGGLHVDGIVRGSVIAKEGEDSLLTLSERVIASLSGTA